MITRFPSRYSRSTSSWPRVSIRMDRPSARITAAPAGGSTASFIQRSNGSSHRLPIRHILELKRMEPLVVTALQQELIMRARFDDGATIHDDDPVRPLHR